MIHRILQVETRRFRARFRHPPGWHHHLPTRPPTGLGRPLVAGSFSNLSDPRAPVRRRTYMRALLTALAAVVILDVALVIGADRQPVAVVVVKEPVGVTPRAAPAGGAAIAATPVVGTGEVNPAAAPVVHLHRVRHGPVRTACGSWCPSRRPAELWEPHPRVRQVRMAALVIVPVLSRVLAGRAAPARGPHRLELRRAVCKRRGHLPRRHLRLRRRHLPSQLAPNRTPSPGAPPATGTMGCVTPNPAAGLPGLTARCVNGTWLIGG